MNLGKGLKCSLLFWQLSVCMKLLQDKKDFWNGKREIFDVDSFVLPSLPPPWSVTLLSLLEYYFLIVLPTLMFVPLPNPCSLVSANVIYLNQVSNHDASLLRVLQWPPDFSLSTNQSLYNDIQIFTAYGPKISLWLLFLSLTLIQPQWSWTCLAQTWELHGCDSHGEMLSESRMGSFPNILI